VPPRWDSLAGRAFWHVIGLEESLKHWAQQVQVSRERANAIAAAERLRKQYGISWRDIVRPTITRPP